MNPDRWRQVDELFAAALECEAEGRDTFLDEACAGDPLLRREIAKMLSFNEGAADFIEDDVFELAASLMTGQKEDDGSGKAAGPLEQTVRKSQPSLTYDSIDDARFVPGDVLAERYRIVGLLGRGGMGEVYRADDLKLKQPVALKFLPQNLSTDAAALARFYREVSVARLISHRHVCRVHDVAEYQGQHFITMEFVRGEELGSLLTRIGHLPQVKAVEIARQLSAGLSAVHEKGILHRDLKPANIMIDERGDVRVTDFGIAALADEVRGREATAGTPGYMSPEQLEGRQLTVSSDIYSLGVVLYEIITGKKAFAAATLPELLKLRRSNQQPASPSQLVAGLDPRIERVIFQCLEQDPHKRPATALQVAAALPGGDSLAAVPVGGEPAEMSAKLNQRYQSIKKDETEPGDSRQSLETGSRLHDSVHRASNNARTITGGQIEIPATKKTIQQALAMSESERPQRTSSARIILNELSRNRRGAVLAFIGLILVVGGAAFVWQKFAGQKAVAPAGTMKITKLTSGGRVNNTVIAGSTSISADGKFVVFALTDAGRQSLWMRQVSTGSDVQIVPSAEGGILGTTISRDSEFVYYVWGNYYVWADKDSPRDELFRVPVFGGTPRKVLTGVNSPIAFSPDGKRFAFLRNLRDQGGVSLMVANSDGSSERTLVTRKGYDFFYSDGPSWSPDGKVIACAAGTLKGGLSTTVVQVSAEGGTEKPLTAQKWPLHLHRVVWLGDGSGLILSADIQGTSGTQLWFISYPEGNARRITNDLNGYGTFSLGLTADNSTIVTVLDDPSMQIWTTALNEPSSVPSQISHGKIDGARGLDWMPDGKIVYVTEGTDNTEIRIMKADGTDSRSLTSDAYIKDYPAVSPDGSYVFFASRISGTPDIWRINADGSNLTQVTSGESAEYAPTCSPDGRWITFNSTKSGTNCLWKVSVDGGEPVQLTDKPATRASFSPDGKLIACGYFVEGAKQPWKVAIIPFAGGPPVKFIDLPQSVNFWAGLWWTSDARAFFYADTTNGVSNLWIQPVDGGRAVQLTNFNTETILHFSVSRDGKRFAISRGHPTADVVLIKDFK
jgi:serine/threonine protein kinase/Tol biopolymer transport system component